MIELTIEKLVPGGEGMARHQGKVVFVPMVLPGEVVQVRQVESKKDFARAELVKVLTPSPDRVLPGCSVFGSCGGCDWQHISYEAQLKQKVALVADALRRTGGIAFPGLGIEPGKPWRYRNRIQIHRGPTGEGGFLARTSHAVVAIKSCPVSRETFDPLFARPERVPNQEGSRESEGRRYAAWSHTMPGTRGGDGGEFLISDEPGATGPGIIISQRVSDTTSESFETVTNSTDHVGSRIEKKPVPEYLGPRIAGTNGEIEVVVLGKTIRFDLRCFFQSNVEMVEKLIPYALDGLQGEEALDLYCGVGLFGAFLKDKFTRVLAVEENPIALEYALGNIGDTHHFLRGRIEDLLLEERGHLAGAKPDVVVVDPPRDGLDKTVKDFLISRKPRKVIYVSCNPVTLARDLKTLLAGGFQLDDLRLFDFYPQTAHVESVAKLSVRA